MTTTEGDRGQLPSLEPWPRVDFERFGPVERTALSRIRQRIIGRLTRNWVWIPHVTHHDRADITTLERLRRSINERADPAEPKLTVLAFLLSALAVVLREYPQFNAALDGNQLVLRRYYHIGIATDTRAGLLVPVLRDVDRRGVREIATEVTTLAETARQGKLTPTQMAGGTFTVSSLGALGGFAFTPIINAPEVAILGVTRAEIAPVWNGSEFVPRLMLPLSLSYDHRVIDGADAARFVTRIAALLSDVLPSDLDSYL